MNLFITILRGFTDTFLWYRFFKKMLGAKFTYGYVWFYLGTLLYGQLNVRFALAETGRGNLIYSCLCSLALCSLLFHGSLIKKGFFVTWLYCVPPVAFNVFFPLIYAAAMVNGQNPEDAGAYASILSALVQYLMLEILQRKLSLLRRDFMNRDAFYLMYIILFIYAANDMMYKMFIGADGFKSSDIWKASVPLSLIALSGLGLYVFCVLFLERRLLERLAKQQYQMIGQELSAFKEQYGQFVKMRHDMKNHVLCLTKLIKDKNIKEADHYLEQLTLSASQGDSTIHTGSIYADAILNPKYLRAVRLGIDISIQMSVPGEDKIAPVDICCLLSNALDNAIEACERGQKETGVPGWIQMKSAVHGQYWVLEIKNANVKPAPLHHGKLLSSKRIHTYGVGLENIKSVVEQCEGVLSLQNEDCFTLNVMLPVPSAAKNGPSASIG